MKPLMKSRCQFKKNTNQVEYKNTPIATPPTRCLLFPMTVTRCIIAFLTWSHSLQSPKISGSISPSTNNCAHVHLHVDWLRDLTTSTLSVSAESDVGRDRRCVFSNPQQKQCRIDNIEIHPTNTGKLRLNCRIHNEPTYTIDVEVGNNDDDGKKKLPDVTEVRNFNIDAGDLITEASLEFQVDQIEWGKESMQNDQNHKKDHKQYLRTTQFVNIRNELDTFETSYVCDDTLSCHFNNVVLSDSNENNRKLSDHEEKVMWLYGTNEVATPCAQMPLTTTAHKRFVTSIGWRKGERPDIRMQNSNLKHTKKQASSALHESSLQCVSSPTILFTMPFPTYYYHAISEGAVPLAHAIHTGYQSRRDVQLVNLQRWEEHDTLPTFLLDILAALSDLAPLSLAQLQEKSSVSKTSLCFRQVSVGYWPTLSTRQDFRGAVEMLRKRVLLPVLSSSSAPSSNNQQHYSAHYPRPPTPWQIGTMDQTNVVPGPPILVIVQRRKVDNVNFDGQDDEEKGNRPTRVIRNVQELHRIGIDLGYTTKVVDLVDMTLREQVKMMQETDVFAAVFGSAWSNVVWMRRHGTTAIMLLGWGFKDGCDFQMPSQTPVRLLSGMCNRTIDSSKNTIHTDTTSTSSSSSSSSPSPSPSPSKRGGRTRGTRFFYNDHCDAVLHEFPALVDADNTYVEIAATNPMQFVAPFSLEDWICHRDPERFDLDYGPRTKENVVQCIKDQQGVQNHAISDPSWAWKHIGINAAHLFFLNADLFVDTIRFERTLVSALTKITRKMTTSNVFSDNVFTTCWASIAPGSDPLVSILTRLALSKISMQNQTTVQVTSAKIRFTISNGGGVDDIRLEMQVNGEYNSQVWFASGVMTLALQNKEAIPFWTPVSFGTSNQDRSIWKDPQFAQSLNYCEDNKDLSFKEAIQRSMSEASPVLHRRSLRQLMVRLDSLTRMEAKTIKTTKTTETTKTVSSNASPFWPVDRKHVVIGVAVNYGMEEFRRFVGTLRATGYIGTILLGVGADLSKECTRYLKRHHVEIRIVQQGKLTPVAKEEDGVNSGFYSVALPRWELYREWIEEKQFDDVNTQFFLTDTRDVYFQRDPFADLKHVGNTHDLFMFEEWNQKTIGTCPHNSDWIRSCWGEKVLQTMFTSPILCSGTILGSRKGIIMLVNALVDEAARVKDLPHEINGKAKHGRPCVNDQAYVNVLLRRNIETNALAKSAHIFKQGDGPINTVGWIGVTDNIKRDNEGFVLNNDGRRSAVVHQYDRDLEMQAWIDARFVHVLDPMHEEWNAGKKYSDVIRTLI